MQTGVKSPLKNQPDNQTESPVRLVIWGLVIFLFLVFLFSSCGWISLLVAPINASADTQSKLRANYGSWPALQFERLDEAIILEIVRDEGWSDAVYPETLSGRSFWGPASSGTQTPQPEGGVTPTLSPMPSTTPTLTRTITPNPSYSPTPSATMTVTSTVSPTLTNTATSTPTSTSTNTQTATATATSTATQTATLTSTPTITQTPTPSTTPTPSNTPPPTATGSCWGDPPPGGLNVGAPDGAFLTLACGTSFIFDLGGDPIVTHPGYDFVYYERLSGGVIFMDAVAIAVCTDSSCSTRYPVFRWGDGALDMNTNIGGAGYTPGEPDNAEIPISDLYGSWPYQTGITIDVDAVAPGGTYRYVAIRSLAVGDMDGAEVDSIQVLP